MTVIIDSHAHLYGPRLTPGAWINAFVDYGCAISSRPPEFVRGRVEETWFDESGDLLISDMDKAGIDKAVVIAIDFALYAGVDDEISLEKRYEIYHQAVNKFSDRLILYGGIDPRRPHSAKFVERAVKEWGLRGFKLWCTGVNPGDRACYRVYEKCAELNLPVVVHTGQEIAPACSEPTRPIYVDQPSNDFPEVTFVLAHAGMAWWEEAASLAWHHPNVYVDTAYWQSKYLQEPADFPRKLRALLSLAGNGKVFFGSDWPALRTVSKVNHANWVEIIQSLPGDEASGVDFTKEEIDLFLGGAAQQALGI